MRNQIVRLLVAVEMALMLAGQVQAGTAGPGNPVNVYFMSNGVALIPMDVGQQNSPSCATQGTRFAIDGSTAPGKVQIAALLTAIAMGKQIVVWGTGTCSVWGDTETVSFFQIVS
jgi:hypothetical protein